MKDCDRVDDKYTKSIGFSIWRFFKIGKYKDREVKKVCYCSPSYIEWCLKNWEGFELTKDEHFDYIQGWKKKLQQNPDNKELALKIERQEVLYKLR